MMPCPVTSTARRIAASEERFKLRNAPIDFTNRQSIWLVGSEQSFALHLRLHEIAARVGFLIELYLLRL